MTEKEESRLVAFQNYYDDPSSFLVRSTCDTYPVADTPLGPLSPPPFPGSFFFNFWTDDSRALSLSGFLIGYADENSIFQSIGVRHIVFFVSISFPSFRLIVRVLQLPFT